MFDLLKPGRWDLMIAHPPCTHLSVSGARWATDHWVKSKKHPGGRYWHDGELKRRERAMAIKFVEKLWFAPVPRIVIENPISVLSTRFKPPTQIVQPWQFGHPEFKATCFWLKNVPELEPTKILTPPAPKTPEHKAWSVVHNAPPGPERAADRSRTYQGIADAMAMQWGGYVERGKRGFCKMCGASVPPIAGEGTCPHCDPKLSC